MRFVVLVWCLVQIAQARPGVLQGHVVRADTGAPVAHARIVVARIGGQVADYRTVVADAAGRFAVQTLPPGTYRLHASHDGYMSAEFGRRPAATSGIPVVVSEGQTSPDLEITMSPTAVITGHVFRNGEPVRNAWVRALKSAYLDGERSYNVADWTQTDDRGEYRLFGLAPGSYLVTAVPRARPVIDGASIVTPTVPTNANGNARSERTDLTAETLTAAAVERTVYSPVYYPGTLDLAAAQAVDLRLGATAAGIDLAVVPSRPFHIRGRATMVEATPGPAISVSAQPADIAYALPVGTARADASGQFDIAGVAPGRYYVSVQASVGAEGRPIITLSDIVPVEVTDEDPPPLSIALRPGVTMTGRLTIDGNAASADPAILVQLRGASVRGSCCAAVPVGPDGTFRLDNVVPGEYRLRVLRPGRTFWIKSATYGGDDALAFPVRVTGPSKGRELEIDIGTRTAALDVLVTDSDQHPLPGVLVIAVPAASRRNQSSAYRSATSGADGRARIDGLGSGDYLLFASDSIPAADWQDPSVLQRFEAHGTALTVQEAETRTMTVRITR